MSSIYKDIDKNFPSREVKKIPTSQTSSYVLFPSHDVFKHLLVISYYRRESVTIHLFSNVPPQVLGIVLCSKDTEPMAQLRAQEIHH